VTWNGKLYGVPTNNETHGFIWNKDIFQKAGLDPEKPPATWEDVKNFSKQIKDKTGKPGYGLVAKLNAGDIPFRYMPLCWAHGGASLDETADSPQYQKSGFDNEGNIAALQWVYDVFVRDQSAPQSAFTNTGVENQNLLLSGDIAMMSGHPTTYALAKKTAPDVAEKLGYTLMPMGPVRRAVVFGGSNIVIFKSAKDLDAAKAIVKDRTSPQWSLYHQWETSNPGNLDAFALPAQQQRLTENKFLNVTTDNLQYGISFPAVPEANDIMNLLVPQMMQDVMTKSKTPQQAGQDAAKKANDMIAKRK
jgi:multiple sugar transport system substrate-binding protein